MSCVFYESRWLNHNNICITIQHAYFYVIHVFTHFIFTITLQQEVQPPYPYFTYTELKLEKVQFSHSVVSDSLWPHGLQHTTPPCPSPTPRVYSNSCPLSRWCHPTISSSVIPFSSNVQSFPASGSLQMSQFFVSGGQSTGVSASALVLPMNIQGWFPLGLTDWISLQS